jgi:hypothetical protein
LGSPSHRGVRCQPATASGRHWQWQAGACARICLLRGPGPEVAASLSIPRLALCPISPCSSHQAEVPRAPGPATAWRLGPHAPACEPAAARPKPNSAGSGCHWQVRVKLTLRSEMHMPEHNDEPAGLPTRSPEGPSPRATVASPSARVARPGRRPRRYLPVRTGPRLAPRDSHMRARGRLGGKDPG